jgi:hypothetical protein
MPMGMPAGGWLALDGAGFWHQWHAEKPAQLPAKRAGMTDQIPSMPGDLREGISGQLGTDPIPYRPRLAKVIRAGNG